jgi:hypothetical protein
MLKIVMWFGGRGGVFTTSLTSLKRLPTFSLSFNPQVSLSEDSFS